MAAEDERAYAAIAVSSASLLDWLSSPDNPPVRYLTARHLVDPVVPPRELARLRREALAWGPLQDILALQQRDGSFPYTQKTPTAQPTFWALGLMERCGMESSDEPVARAVAHLTGRHLAPAFTYTTGGSGVLPCYVGVVTRSLIAMGGLDLPAVQASIVWLAEHQRFDHRESRAGGAKPWPYKAPDNYGCWASVSCYHGVAGAFRALAAIPAERRSPAVAKRLEEALAYLRIHRVYKRTREDRPIVDHLTRFFFAGDWRSDLIDVLAGIAEADASLIREPWVSEAVADVGGMLRDGRVIQSKCYAKKLTRSLGFEPLGEPSRFLTYQWLRVKQRFDARCARRT